MLSCKQLKIKPHIEEHSRKRVWAKHGAIRGNSIIYQAKDVFEQIKAKGTYTSILEASRMMRNFTQASQNITTGQKNGPN